MSKISKTDKFLDIKTGKYNLGVVPNMIISRMVHEIHFSVVKQQLIDKYNHRRCWQKHRRCWQKVMDDILIGPW
jgi:hypothetical protein